MSEAQVTAEKKSGLVDWDSVDLPRTKAKIDYLRLKTGNTYTVRLFHKPKPIFRYYVKGPDGKSRSALTEDPEHCKISVGHPDVKAKSRYAIIVIDRADQNVKVLEAPAGVFKDIKNFYVDNGIDPGGNEGPDFTIKVTGEGLKTRYTVGYKMGSKPFTDDEKAKIRQKRDVEGYNLDEIFKPTPQDKIEEVLFGRGADGDEGGDDPVETPTPAASAKKDDLGWA